MSRPRRAAIVGFAGFGNLGDEAIAAGIDALLGTSSLEVTTVFGGPRLAESPAFPRAVRLASWRLLPTLPALRRLRGIDVLLVGGGGLLNDHWPAVVPRYVSWMIAGRLAGARVAWVGVGVGPIRHVASRWLVRVGARLSGPLLVRDPASARLLGAEGRRAVVIPDPALFLDLPARVEREGTLGLVVRPPIHPDASSEDRLLTLLEEVAVAGSTEGLAVRIWMMAPEVDRAFAERLAGRLEKLGIEAPIARLGPAPADAVEQLAAHEAVVSVRLHGVLLSVLAGVPCLPIAYDAKVVAAAEQLALGDLVLDMTAGPAGIAADLLRAARDPARVARTRERLVEMRSRADELREMLAA